MHCAICTVHQVLEQAVYDCEQRCKQLLAATLAAQQQEQQVRQSLAVAREQAAAAERAVQQQTQRLLAVERDAAGRSSGAQVKRSRAAGRLLWLLQPARDGQG